MPEGARVAGGQVVSGAVHDNPEVTPPPGPDAPKGWTWNRADRVWQPKQRGAVVWADGGGGAVAEEHDRPYPFVLGGGQQQPEAPAPPETFGKDPAPGWQQQDQGTGRHVKLTFEQVPQQVKDDIAGMAGLVGTPILALVRSVDPYCGGALADSYEGIIDATLPLMCRSEKIVKYFSEDTADWLLWGKVAMALAPVGKAIAEHHIFHTVEVVRDEKTGAVEIRPTAQDGGLAQNLTPPAANPDAYAA